MSVMHYPSPTNRAWALCNTAAMKRVMVRLHDVPTCQKCVEELRLCLNDPQEVYDELLDLAEGMFWGSEL